MATLNYGITAAWIITIAIIVVAILYFIHFAPVVNIVSYVVNGLKGALGSASGKGLVDVVSKNITTIVGVGAVLVPMGIAYVKTYSKQKAAEKATDAAQKLMMEQQQAADAKLRTLQGQIDTLNSDTTADTLQSNLSGLTSKYSTLEDNFAKAQTLIEVYKAQTPKIQAQVVNELWQASGGKVLNIGGESVKLIEKTVIK